MRQCLSPRFLDVTMWDSLRLPNGHNPSAVGAKDEKMIAPLFHSGVGVHFVCRVLSGGGPRRARFALGGVEGRHGARSPPVCWHRPGLAANPLIFSMFGSTQLLPVNCWAGS